jgi:hypothetical protein
VVTQAAAWPGERAAQLLRCAAGLRWDRPDLVAGLAEHAVEIAGGDDVAWAGAAGWLLHARSAVGDGRPCAVTLIEELGHRRAGLFDDPAAARLRVEIALIAAVSGRPERAREIVSPVMAGAAPADVRADAFGVLARCVAEERPEGVAEAARRAEVAWAEVGDADAEIGAAAVALVTATALRRSGRPGAAVGRAADGLGRLDQVRGSHSATPSRHLAAALAAEWISALVDDGRLDDAREGCGPLQARLREPARPSRQVALLRLTVARADAGSGPTPATQALLQAADDAAAADTPGLEAVCLSALGALHEKAGRLDVALETVRRGVAAQRRDAARRDAFLAALGDVPAATEPAAAAPAEGRSGGSPIGDLLERTFGVRAPADSRYVAPENDPRPDIDREQPPSRSAHAEPAYAEPGLGEPVRNAGEGGRPVHSGEGRGGAGRYEPGHAGAARSEPAAGDTGKVGSRSNGVASRRARGDDGPPPDPLFGDLWPDALAEITAAAGDLPSLSPGPGNPGRPDPVTPEVGGGAAADEGGSHPLSGSPWSTGWWTAVRPDPAPSQREGRRQRPEPAVERPAEPAVESPADPAVESPAGPSEVRNGSPSSSGVDEWLRTAMAELDRVWGGPFLSTTPARPEAAPQPQRPPRRSAAEGGGAEGGGGERSGAEGAALDLTAARRTGRRAESDRPVPAESGAVGCVVIVDVTRSGEPVGDDRAVAAVDAVAGQLETLPAGARLRRNGPALSIVMPGRDRAGAAEWMHRNLPGVFADCASTGVDGGLALRASVHDVDGPVGAQLVQRLAPARTPGRRRGSGSGPDVTPSRPGGRRRRPEPGDDAAQPAGPTWDGTAWIPAEAPATPPPAEAPPTPSPAERATPPWAAPAEARPAERAGPAPSGPGTTAVPDRPSAPSPDPSPGPLEPLPLSADLGLADLLAGALAAYRGM